METKEVSLWVEGDATLYSPVSSVSFGISHDVTYDEVCVAILDAEDVDFTVAERTKLNP